MTDQLRGRGASRAVRCDSYHGAALTDDGRRPRGHFPRLAALGVDVCDLLQLESRFEGRDMGDSGADDEYVVVPAERVEEPVRLSVPRGDRVLGVAGRRLERRGKGAEGRSAEERE